jgi:sec-independent protein translocase protein TatB
VFGFSFSELVVLAVVALVVIGPSELPKVLKKVGFWAGKLRRMAGDLRAQSGIDDVLRNEGLNESIHEIRKLARGEIESVAREVNGVPAATSLAAAETSVYSHPLAEVSVSVDREYPRDGADAYGALPDTAIVYDNSLPASALARDPVYVLGDPAAVVPEPVPPVLETEADIPADAPSRPVLAPQSGGQPDEPRAAEREA